VVTPTVLQSSHIAGFTKLAHWICRKRRRARSLKKR
jgi:hypothetical protein